MNELFEHYRKHHNTPIPRDTTFLHGMYVIRRTRGTTRAMPGEITKSAPALQRVQIRNLEGEENKDWVAIAALIEDCILFHSKNEMWGAYSALARSWQHETAQTGGARG